MNPVSLSEKQEEKILLNLDPIIQEKYELFTQLINNEDHYDENEKLISKDVKKNYIRGLTEELGIQDVYDNLTLYRKLNLVVFNDSTFELLEATKSGSIIKCRDGKDKEFQITEKEYSNINKKLSKIKSLPKIPKSKIGQDALRKLSGGGG
jgi:hypothetical protein